MTISRALSFLSEKTVFAFSFRHLYNAEFFPGLRLAFLCNRRKVVSEMVCISIGHAEADRKQGMSSTGMSTTRFISISIILLQKFSLLSSPFPPVPSGFGFFGFLRVMQHSVAGLLISELVTG